MTKPKRRSRKPKTKAVRAPVPEAPVLGIGAPTGEIPEELQEIMKRNSEQFEELRIEPARAPPVIATSTGRAAAIKRWLARVFIGP